MNQGNVITQGPGVPYCRVEGREMPGASHYGKRGVCIQRLNAEGDEVGAPLLFSDAGSMELERLIREARG